MHAQRMCVVVCQTALTCYRACYDISRARVACVWGAALPNPNFVSPPGGYSIEGFGVSFVFFGTGTRRLVPDWDVVSTT